MAKFKTILEWMMTKYKVFIDGQHGTTGLQIFERLKNHPKVEIVEMRKDLQSRLSLIESSDITFLCLPDHAAREIANELSEIDTKVIDASSAHRCEEAWTYGLPELSKGHRENLRNSKRVANPGCYATGAILLLKPLLDAKVISSKTHIHINGYSGYSGGGNMMISDYESNAEKPSAFSLYGLNFCHKHIPEIITHCNLANRPTFFPSVVNCKQGMIVLISFHKQEINASTSQVKQAIFEAYENEEFVSLNEHSPEASPFFQIEGLENTNRCDLYVFESPDKDQVLLLAKLDNLGKGASGAAVQNMNIMLGIDESLGVHNVEEGI